MGFIDLSVIPTWVFHVVYVLTFGGVAAAPPGQMNPTVSAQKYDGLEGCRVPANIGGLQVLSESEV